MEELPFIKWRYLDLIIFGLIAILAIFAAITYDELSELRHQVHSMELGGRR